MKEINYGRFISVYQSQLDEIIIGVVLKHDRCAIFSFGVGFESESLLNDLLGVGERDEGEILQHAVGLQARVSLVQQLKELCVFLPLSYFSRLSHGLPIDADEPQFVSVIVHVDRLFLAFPHGWNWVLV